MRKRKQQMMHDDDEDDDDESEQGATTMMGIVRVAREQFQRHFKVRCDVIFYSVMVLGAKEGWLSSGTSSLGIHISSQRI